MNFTIGCDPEFIVINKQDIISAINIIKGTRDKRIKIKNTEIYYDNVLAECTVKPASSKEEFVENIQESINLLSEIIFPYKLSQLSSAIFTNEELEHPDAKKSGCAAEYCAYSLSTISPNKINKIFKNSNLRTAGGHVHLGTNLGKNHESCVMLVRMLDLFLGFISLILDSSQESIERRKIYGSAGRYRQPFYGVEYRTLGNFWIFNNQLIRLLYDICEFVIKFTEDRGYENFWKVDNEKLDSDEFWNNGGDPADCHLCFGYDVFKFRKLFFMNKQELIEQSKEIKQIIDRYLPDNIKNQISLFGAAF